MILGLQIPFLTAIALLVFPAGLTRAGERLFIGSGTDGIYSCTFSNGTLGEVRKAFPLESGSCVEVGPRKEILYAGVRSPEPGGNGVLIALRILADGTLKELNRRALTVDHFCSLAVSKRRDLLVGASYGRGVVASFPLAPEGAIGELQSHEALPRFPKGRSDLARAHDVEFGNDDSHLFVPDIANDRVYTFAVGAKGSLVRQGFTTSKAFQGPRHLTLNAKSDRLYVLNQKGSSIVGFSLDGRGMLTEFQHIPTIPPDYDGPQNHSAEILFHPSGRFLYASNRIHDSLATFGVDEEGKLMKLQSIDSGGQNPWSFVVTSDGRHLICSNRKSNNLVVFAINRDSGELRRLESTRTVPDPVSMTR